MFDLALGILAGMADTPQNAPQCKAGARKLATRLYKVISRHPATYTTATRVLALLLVSAVATIGAASSSSAGAAANAARSASTTMATAGGSTAVATVAGGCFWCVEGAFSVLKGVRSATSGYTGGHVVKPTYEQVCGGDTGHAEAVRIEYDPEVLTFKKVLDIFFKVHDPTTLNRQGNDSGTQYRSAIFYHSPEQQAEALAYIKEAQAHYSSRIVTEVRASARACGKGTR